MKLLIFSILIISITFDVSGRDCPEVLTPSQLAHLKEGESKFRYAANVLELPKGDTRSLQETNLGILAGAPYKQDPTVREDYVNASQTTCVYTFKSQGKEDIRLTLISTKSGPPKAPARKAAVGASGRQG